MTFYTQQHLASIRRRDGHTIDGIAGDCLKACVASIIGVDNYDDVPHFAQFRDSWWAKMRLHGRAAGFDWAAWAPDDFADVTEAFPARQLVILSGPSPRGPWWHCVVGDLDLNLVHDPHPSRAGLISIGDVIAPVLPYLPAPYVRQIEMDPPVPRGWHLISPSNAEPGDAVLLPDGQLIGWEALYTLTLDIRRRSYAVRHEGFETIRAAPGR